MVITDPEQAMHFVTSDFDSSWESCLPIWRNYGRVEDYPHGVRRTAYWPNFAKKLGLEFVKQFYDQPERYIAKLNSDDEVVRLIAYDLIELLVWERKTNQDDLPPEFLDLELPIPDVALEGIRNDELFVEFKGNSVGEFLPHFWRQDEAQ